MADVRIESNGVAGKVLIDGKEVPGVHSFSVSGSAGTVPVLQLNVLASTLTYDGAGVLPALPEPWSHFYILREPLE